MVNSVMVRPKQGLVTESITVLRITYADIPLMNPSDWISIYYILVLRGDESYQPQIDFFKLLMQNYMWELGKFDVVVANLMKEKPHTVNTNFVDYGINSDGLYVF